MLENDTHLLNNAADFHLVFPFAGSLSNSCTTTENNNKSFFYRSTILLNGIQITSNATGKCEQHMVKATIPIRQSHYIENQSSLLSRWQRKIE